MSSGDSVYINEARRIQENLQQLLLIASELNGGHVSFDFLRIKCNVCSFCDFMMVQKIAILRN